MKPHFLFLMLSLSIGAIEIVKEVTLDNNTAPIQDRTLNVKHSSTKNKNLKCWKRTLNQLMPLLKKYIPQLFVKLEPMNFQQKKQFFMKTSSKNVSRDLSLGEKVGLGVLGGLALGGGIYGVTRLLASLKKKRILSQYHNKMNVLRKSEKFRNFHLQSFQTTMHHLVEASNLLIDSTNSQLKALNDLTEMKKIV